MDILPHAPLAQAQNVARIARAHCPGLLAAYLHGSICLGGYVPGRSDLDLLLVSEGSMTRAERTVFADALLPLHGAPCPVELSVVTRAGLLPEVDDEVFWRSITDGIEDFSFEDYGLFASNILTLPRILSFAHLRRVLTKAQGGRWGMDAFPEYADLLRRALAEYEGGQAQTFPLEELSAFRAKMLEEIAKGLR